MRLAYVFVLMGAMALAQTFEGTFTKVLTSVGPVYPEQAKSARLQGTVSLYVTVASDGTPQNISVLHGLGLGLDQAAIEAVAKWRFEPAKLDGRPIEMARFVQVPFDLGAQIPWRVRYMWFETKRGKRSEAVAPELTFYQTPSGEHCTTGGHVRIQLEVDAIGAVKKSKADRKDPMADAAIAAVGSWRFRPSLVDGKPQEAKGEVEFECGQRPALTDSAIFPVLSLDSKVQVLRKTEPSYTTAGVQAKLEGDVWLSAVIDPAGCPIDIHVTRPLGLGLDEKAMAALGTWRFSAGVKNGAPVSTRSTIAISFRLI